MFSVSADAAPFTFSTGSPDGLIGLASRPGSAGVSEIEAADDFVLTLPTTITGATFTGLIPSNVPLSSVSFVGVEIYRVFPLDSTNPPNGLVPSRTNSPSDNALAADGRDSTAGLTFTTTLLSSNFTAANSILNGINPIPGQTTGGEGPVTGQEVQFTITFTTPLVLPADHYFFKPEVGLTGAGNFYWLSAPKPITSGTPFTPDLQAWIRNTGLDPNWLRAGTDIVGPGPNGAAAPQFNASFSLIGATVPEPTTIGLMLAGLAVIALKRRVTRP